MNESVNVLKEIAIGEWFSKMALKKDFHNAKEYIQLYVWLRLTLMTALSGIWKPVQRKKTSCRNSTTAFLQPGEHMLLYNITEMTNLFMFHISSKRSGSDSSNRCPTNHTLRHFKISIAFQPLCFVIRAMFSAPSPALIIVLVK